MMSAVEDRPLTAGEQSFVSPPTDEDRAEAERAASAATDVLQRFVALGKRYGFPTSLVAGYILHQQKALDTWAEDTQHRNKDDLAFCVVVYLVAKKNPEVIVRSRLGAKAAATWLARPRVQALLAEIEAGKQAIVEYENGLTERIAEVLGFAPGTQPTSPNVREWLAGGRADDSLLRSDADRSEAAGWF